MYKLFAIIFLVNLCIVSLLKPLMAGSIMPVSPQASVKFDKPPLRASTPMMATKPNRIHKPPLRANKRKVNRLGYLTDTGKYISLEPDGVSYSGTITSFNQEQGFSHTKMKAHFLEEGNVLRLVARQGLPSETFTAKYSPTRIDGNTVWRQELLKPPTGPGLLMGTTLKFDENAMHILRDYERNIDRNSIQIQEFSRRRLVRETVCGFQVNLSQTAPGYCNAYAIHKIALIVEQAQVGLWDLIATQIGESNDVQTFVAGGRNKAILLANASVIDTMARATDATFKDGTIDLSKNIIVKSNDFPQSLPKQAKILRWTTKSIKLFKKINTHPAKLKDIDLEFRGLANSLSPHMPNCSYSMDRFLPFIYCYNHTSDLGLVGTGAWIKSFYVLQTKNDNVYDNNTLEITASLEFLIKYDKLENKPPDGTYEPLDHERPFEDDVAEASIRKFVKALRTHYEDRVAFRGLQ